MAQGRRVERVAALIRKEVSELMINGIRDERVHQGMVSITEFGDAHHALVHPFITDAVDHQFADFFADQGGHPLHSTPLCHHAIGAEFTMARSTKVRLIPPLIKAPIKATAVTGLLRRAARGSATEFITPRVKAIK